MSIRENVSQAILRFKTMNQLSLSALSEELGVPVSSLQCYIKGSSDLRADTIELLAGKMGISVTNMVSGPTPAWEQAETIVRAAKIFAGLPEDRRNRGLQLFTQLVALLAEDS